MRGDEDLMARYACGKGVVYLSSVALNEEDSNFPRHALFVPLLYRMALLSTQHYPLYYVIGKDRIVRAGKLEPGDRRSEEHTSELQSLMRISYAVFCLKKKI